MSADRYRQTLNHWAQQFVTDKAKVTRVEITYDDGYEPTLTDRPESFSIGIGFEIDGVSGWWIELPKSDVPTLGELLTRLFAIESEVAP
jgi:hypothetical protein